MRIIFITLQFMLLLSCGFSQKPDTAFLEMALPRDVGLAPEPIDRLVEDIETGRIANIHGILIIKDSKIVLEKYFQDFGRNDLHYTASVSKSFASVLLGIAIDKGYFGGDISTVLDRTVTDLFPEYKDLILLDSLKRGLKLKHMLSMTAGFQWDEHSHPYSDQRNDCYRINHSRDPMKFLFERPLVSEPGREFYYNGGLSLSISWLIEKYTGMKVDKFADKYLFNALGIKDYRWEKVAGDLIDTDGGLHMKPMDQAKLGYLFLNKGKWNGIQLLSEEWIRVSTQMHVEVPEGPDYGYQWWGGNFHSKNLSFQSYLASGHGGQKILVIPEYDLIVVLSQQVFSNPFGDLNFLATLISYIGPAISGETSEYKFLDLTEEELAIWTGRYMSPCKEHFIDVCARQGSIELRTSSGEINEFYPVSKNIFVCRILDLLEISVEFQMDEPSEISTLVSNFGYRGIQYTRE